MYPENLIASIRCALLFALLSGDLKVPSSLVRSFTTHWKTPKHRRKKSPICSASLLQQWSTLCKIFLFHLLYPCIIDAFKKFRDINLNPKANVREIRDMLIIFEEVCFGFLANGFDFILEPLKAKIDSKSWSKIHSS